MPPLECKVVARPSSLAREEAAALTAELVRLDTLAAAGLHPGEAPGPADRASLAASEEHWTAHPDFVRDLDGLVLARSDTEVVGFIGYTIWPSPQGLVQFTNIAAVRPDWQRRGVLTRLARLATFEMVKRRERKWYASARTVNPAVADAWWSVERAPELFPNLACFPFDAPSDVVAVGELAARRSYPGSTFEPCLFVARRPAPDPHLVACAAGALRRAPIVDRTVARFFSAAVDAFAGDAVVLVQRWEWPLPASSTADRCRSAARPGGGPRARGVMGRVPPPTRS